MRRRSRTRRVLLCVGFLGIAIIVLVVYLGFYHRWRVTVQRDGWLVQFSYRTLECVYCCGIIERLECNGRPVPKPHLEEKEDKPNRLHLGTPAGLLVLTSGDRWRISHSHDRRAGFMPESITAAELAQGWYTTGYDIATGYGTPPRKKGTPDHWCWVWPSFARACWLDPMVLDQLDWNAKVPADTTSQPTADRSSSDSE